MGDLTMSVGTSRDEPPHRTSAGRPGAEMAARADAPTVQRLLARAFRRYHDRPCLVWEGGQATYAETAHRVAGLAAWLADHATGTRHVAIALPNGRAYLESILACALANVVRVPLGAREPVDVIRAKLVESDSEVVVCEPDLAAELAELRGATGMAAVLVSGEPPVAPPGGPTVRYADLTAAGAAAFAAPPSREADRYRLSFTGGTTGVPKAVVQGHRQERAMIRNLLMEVLRPGAGTAFVAATPLAHAAGAFVMPTVLAGGSLGWLSRFDPTRLADASWLGTGGAVRGVETFVVPTALADLAEAAGGRHQLRGVVYGGAPCPAPVLARAVDRLGAGRLVQVYGQAEAPVTICVAGPADHAEGRVTDGWVGHPFAFVGVEIAGADRTAGGVGEVVVRAEHVMEGYWNRPEESAARLDPGGGLLTGDLGRLDAGGGLRIVGRARELVISGGFNVYPDDVERRLRQAGLPDVPLAVFGVPHPRWGEAVVVAARRDRAEPDEQRRGRVERAAAAVLAYYERPKAVVVVDELPLTPVGKIARRELATTFRCHFDGPGDRP